MTQSVALAIEAVGQSYGASKVLRSIDLKVFDGEILCLLGPSGCGKTTLLRTIAGFESIEAGSIALHGEVVSRSDFCLRPEHRKVGIVFQNYALFPHLSVRENIAFGLRTLSKAEKAMRVEELLRIVEMTSHADKLPRQLSGGQQQRVALARALAPGPQILLLDEPFSSLDPSLREKLRREIRQLLKKLRVTAVFVTHDQAEAFDLADRIALMLDGKIAQLGSAEEIYAQPINAEVASFVGQSFVWDGKLVRPEDLELAAEGVSATVSAIFYRGARSLIEIQVDDAVFQVEVEKGFPVPKVSERVKVRLKSPLLTWTE